MADYKGTFIPDYVHPTKRQHHGVSASDGTQEAPESTGVEGGATTPPVAKKKAKKAPSQASKKKARK